MTIVITDTEAEAEEEEKERNKFITRLFESGNSSAMRTPKALCAKYGLTHDTHVLISGNERGVLVQNIEERLMQ